MSIISIPNSSGLAEAHGPSGSAQAPRLELNNAPAFLDSVPPVYLDIARRAHIEGTVVIQAVISAKGELEEANFVSRVNPLLDRAALVALQESSFVSAVTDGKNCSGDFQVSYSFDLGLYYRQTIRMERPTIDWTPPLISEVGKLLETRESDEMDYGVFSFEGVKVYGDLPVELFRGVLKEIKPHLKEGEEVHSINHHLAYKELGEMGYMGVCDLEILTCAKKNSEGLCTQGEQYMFKNQGGVYTLEFPKGTHKMWVH